MGYCRTAMFKPEGQRGWVEAGVGDLRGLSQPQ